MASQEPTLQAVFGTQDDISPHLDELLRSVADLLTAEELTDVVASIKNTFEGNFQTQPDQDLHSCLRLFATQGLLSEENLTLLERFVACKSSKKKGITNRIEKFKLSRQQEVKPSLPREALKGRESALNVVMSKLAGDQAIVNLYGSSGMGKTTLGKEICLKWPGKSISVDLREITVMQDVYFHIMLALDTQRTVIKYDENPVIKQLQKLRKESPSDVLLLLDNVDQFAGGDEDLGKTLNAKLVELLKRLTDNRDKNMKCNEGMAGLKVLLISRTRFHGLSLNEGDYYEVKALEKGFSKELLQKAGGLPRIGTDQIEKLVEMCKGKPLLLNRMAAIFRLKVTTTEKVLEMIEQELTTLETQGKAVTSPEQEQQERESWNSLSKEIGEDQLSCLRKMFFLLSSDTLKFSAIALSLFCHPFSEEAAASILGVESSEAVIVLEGLRSSEVLSVDPEAKELLYDIHPLMRSFLRSLGNSPVFREVYTKAKDRFCELYFSKMTSIGAMLDKDYMSAFEQLSNDKSNFELALEISFKADYLHGLKEHHKIVETHYLLEAMLDGKQRRKIFKSWAEATEEDGRIDSIFRAEMRCYEALQVLELQGWKSATEVLNLADDSLQTTSKELKSSNPCRRVHSIYLYVEGEIYYKKGSIPKALESLHISLKIKEDLLGSHTSTTRCLNAIGNCYNMLGNFKEALTFYTRACEMRRALSGSNNHVDFPFFKGQIGTVYEVQKEYDKAIQCYQEALELSKELKRAGILRLALFHRNIANAHAWKREFEKAYKSAMDAYEIRKDILGDHPDTARSAFQVGEICRSLEEFDEAEEFLAEAWRIERSLKHGNHSAVRDRIVDSYEYVLKGERKKEFQKEALEFYQGLWEEDKEFSYAKKSIIDRINERLSECGDRKMRKKYQKEALQFYDMAWNSPDLQKLPHHEREEILQNISYLSKVLREKDLHQKYQGEIFRFFEKQWEERTAMTAQDEKDILYTLQNLATQLGHKGKGEKYKRLYEECKRQANSRQSFRLESRTESKVEPSGDGGGSDRAGEDSGTSDGEKQLLTQAENKTIVSQETSTNKSAVSKQVGLPTVEESSLDMQFPPKQREQETVEHSESGILRKEGDLLKNPKDIQLCTTSNSASGIITSKGGVVTAKDVQLLCLPGAVDNPVSIRITLEDPVRYYGLVVQRGLENDIIFGAPIVNLLPNGHLFKKPITLTAKIKVNEGGFRYQDFLVLHGTEAKDGTISWQDITQSALINVPKNEVSIELERFSYIKFLLRLTRISTKEIVSRLNLMPFNYSMSVLFKKSSSELALLFMSQDIFHEPYYREHDASSFVQLRNDGFELLHSSDGNSDKSIYNSESLQVSAYLGEDYRPAANQQSSTSVIVESHVWWSTGHVIKLPLVAIKDVSILCGRISVQGQYGHTSESHFCEQDLHGYVRRLLRVEGAIFNLIPIAEKLGTPKESTSQVVECWKDEDSQLKILLEPWLKENGVTEDLANLRKGLEDLKEKEQDYKLTKRGQMHIRHLRELAVKIAELQIDDADLMKYLTSKIQNMCKTVLRDSCIQIEDSAEDVEEASSFHNHAKYLEIRQEITEERAARYQQLLSSTEKSVTKHFLASVPYLIQDVKTTFRKEIIPAAFNGLRGLHEDTLEQLASKVRVAEENNKVRQLVCQVCKIVEELCVINCDSKNSPDQIRKWGQSLGILPMLEFLKPYFQKCPRDVRLHKRLELLSCCIRDIVSDEIDVSEVIMRDFFDVSSSLVHFAKFDPSKLVRFQLSDATNSSIECEREGMQYIKDSDTYYEQFFLFKEVEKDLLLHAVAHVNVKGTVHKIGAFQSAIILPKSAEEAFDLCYTSFAYIVKVTKLETQDSPNVRVVLCSAQQERLSELLAALKRDLKDKQVDWRRSQVTGCKLTTSTLATKPAKTVVSLRLVYKWRSKAVLLDSKDFVVCADSSTEAASTPEVPLVGMGDSSVDEEADRALLPPYEDYFIADFPPQRTMTRPHIKCQKLEFHQHVHHKHTDVNIQAGNCAVGDQTTFSIQTPPTSPSALPPGPSTAPHRSITDGSHPNDSTSSGQ